VRRRRASSTAGLLALALGLAGIASPSTADESALLSRVRRLTFEGRRAGEGYFSSDGSALVFQSEREPGNPFFQIYVLDLRTGETRRVSTGTGKTTCAFFRPGSRREVLFASTHHDPASAEHQRLELEQRASGVERRYAWDYDPEMELYVRDQGSGALRRLTEARGYDAEGSYSPDGEWIVWSSNRAAYARPLARAEQRRLERDPAYHADLYRARADGSGVERITDAPGYDGGPFFFADGSRIVWRRFDESGLRADLFTARPDGSDARRITDFGAMSWAPYPHPSGAYVVFASNKLGFENFELFLVDAEGTREPVRVTDTPGFDGLPVFSPDGRTLSWTSSRHQRSGDGGQLYLAGWDHERALEALASAPPRTGAAR
jgi:Tol biopolymer transport system component